MNKIIEENGDEYINTKYVLNCQKRFYQNLYDELNVIDDVSISDTLGDNETKLSDQEAENLEDEITLIELTKALKNMKNDKSPGLDGFTVDFFFFFFFGLISVCLSYGH